MEGALAAARELLPAWVVWGRVVAPPVFVFLTQLSVSAWTLLLLERSAGPNSGLHWTERARRITRVTVAMRVMSWCILAPALLVPGFLPNALDPVPGGVVTIASLCAMYLGTYLGAPPVLRRVLGWELSASEWRRSLLTRILIFRSSTLITFVCLLLVPKGPNAVQLTLLAAGAALIMFFELGQGWRLLRALGLAWELEVPPEVAAVNRKIRFLEVEMAMANAVALPRASVVLVTRRAREALEPQELAAGLYHELGHAFESRGVAMLRASTLPLLLTIAGLRPLLGWLGQPGTLVLLGGCLLLLVLARRRARHWETQADTHAHGHLQDPRIFARATERLHIVNLTPAAMEQRGTHPDLYDRMLAAGLTPEYPRPETASSGGGWVVIATLVLMAELVMLGEWTQPNPSPRDEQGLLRALAIGGYPAVHLRALAEMRKQHGDANSAEILRTAAQEIGSQR